MCMYPASIARLTCGNSGLSKRKIPTRATPTPPAISTGMSFLRVFSFLADGVHRLLWDSEQYDFKDPPTAEEQERVINLLPEHTPCVNCGFAAEEELRRQLRPLGPHKPNGFTQFGYDYHVGDFVFVKPRAPSPSPLLIGQIIHIDGLAPGELEEDRIVCSIQYFKRYVKDDGYAKDEASSSTWSISFISHLV